MVGRKRTTVRVGTPGAKARLGTTGMTLVEVMVAVGISSIVVMGAYQIFIRVMGHSSQTQKRTSIRGDFSAFVGFLKKRMVSSNMRFFAFSGYSGPEEGQPISVGDNALGRFLIPVPGVCADLSTPTCGTTTTNCCQDDIALMYIDYQYASTPSVAGICALDASTIIVDMYNPLYGTPTMTSGNVSVAGDTGFPGGTVSFKAGSQLAMAYIPVATLWTVSKDPSPYSINYTTTNGVITYDDVTFNGNPDCTSNIQFDSSTSLPKLDKLYAVKVSPLVISQWTGKTTPSALKDTTTLGSGHFPTRLFNFNINTIGKTVDAQGKGRLAIRRCQYTGSGTYGFTCNSNDLIWVGSIDHVRMDEYFTMKLDVSNTNVSRYELIGGPMATALPAVNGAIQCNPFDTNADCAQLQMPALGSLKVALPLNGNNLPLESFETLSNTQFSLLKQQALSRIQFRVRFTQPVAAGSQETWQETWNDGRTDIMEESFDAPVF